MPVEENKCPLCDRDARVLYVGGSDRVICPCCGTYKVTPTVRATAFKGAQSDQEVKDLIPYLSAYTRQATERGEEVTLTSENWREFARAHAATTVRAKIDKLLDLLASRGKPGNPVRLDPKCDPPLIDAASPGELSFLLEHLVELDYAAQMESWVYKLKAKAWERLESAAAGSGIPGRCFVAMSFDESLNEAYLNGIYMAIKNNCQLEPVRIDFEQFNESIIDRIITEIRLCQFMVADFTRQSKGVYFEAGFAMGLGRPVIWTCQKDDLKNLHFDTKQYNYILWQTPDELREKLAYRIKATILK